MALVASSFLVSALAYEPLALASRAAGVRIVWWPWLNLLVALLANAITLRWLEKRPWSDLYLGRQAARPAPLASGAVLGLLAIGMPSALLVATGLLQVRPAAEGSSLAAAAGLLAFLAPAALFEELLVRGYPFLVIRESAGPVAALATTGLVFGLLHWWNAGATPASVVAVTLAGIFLGAIVLVLRSLWAAFAAHLAWNWTLGALLHAPISGLTDFATPDYRVVDAGPDWVTGGAWGPEGGVGAVAGMLAATTLLIARARSRRGVPWSDLFARPVGRGG